MRISSFIPRILPLYTLAYVTGLFLGIEAKIGMFTASICVVGGVLLVFGAYRRRFCFEYTLVGMICLIGIWVQARSSQQKESRKKEIEHFLRTYSSGEDSLTSMDQRRHRTSYTYIGRVYSLISTSAKDTLLQIQIERVQEKNIENLSGRSILIEPNILARIKINNEFLEFVHIGDEVCFSTTLYGPGPASNPISFDTSRFTSEGDVEVWGFASSFGVLNSRYEKTISPMNEVYLWIQGYVEKLRLYLVLMLKKALWYRTDQPYDPTSYAVLASLVLGERYALKDADTFRKAKNLPCLEAAFRDAGIYHMVSVSGLHLAIVSYLFYVILAKLLLYIPFVSQALPTQKIAASCSIFVVILYALLTRAEIATVRAAWMTIFGLMAILCNRRAKLSESISFAALCILGPWAHPLDLLDPSLQLSIGSLLGIAYFQPFQGLGAWFSRFRFTETLQKISVRSKAISWALKKSAQSIEITLSVMLITAPLCAYYFFQFQSAAPIGNLFALPLGEFLVLPLGFFGLALSCICQNFGFFILRISGLFVEGMVFITDKIAQLSLSYNVPPPSPGMLVLWFGGCLLISLRKQCGLILLMGVLILYFISWQWPERELKITFFDVGQGDAAVIETPHKKVIVMDAGGGYSHSSFDPGEKILAPFLRSHGYQRIDLMIASHPHADHVGGLSSLLEQFPVTEFWTAEPLVQDNELITLHSEPVWKEVLERVHQRQIFVRFPYPKILDDVFLEPLGPCHVIGKQPCSILAHPEFSPNDNSIVLRVNYAGQHVLFAGDIEQKGEQWLLAQENIQINASLLKAPHHCSQTSTSNDFLQAVAPKIAICSVGKKNRYGFPHAQVLSRFRAQGIQIYRTDIDGAIRAIIHEQGGLEMSTILPKVNLSMIKDADGI